MSVETAPLAQGFVPTGRLEGDLAQATMNQVEEEEHYEVSLSSTDSKQDAASTSSSSSASKTTTEESINHHEPIKCSAVATMERQMPDFDYSHLVHELRGKILADNEANPGLYSHQDIQKCKDDDWYLSRFLLRQKLDVDNAFEMLRKAMRFNNENLMSFIKPEDFPAEFYQIGGLFPYQPDRKGNKMLYVRVKIHKKISEINAVIQAFLYYNIQRVDQEAQGKGITIVFDCSGAGLANADMDMLLMLVTTLLNYFPKGFSYLLVHELPWILKPFWYIARAWLPDEYKDLVKFSNSQTIYEYVDKENLPDFMGGTCEWDYKTAPDNCTRLSEAAKLWGVDRKVARKILTKFAEHLSPEQVEAIEKELDAEEEDEEVAQNSSS